MSPPALDALVSWVLGGGALAAGDRPPGRLHSPWLEALAGGHVQSSAAARQLSAVTQFAVPRRRLGKGSAGRRAAHRAASRAQPSRELAATFFGLSGANLRVSPWGESCSYGLGEVHFLAFNPDTELGASDPWLRLKMVDLVRHAWERASVVALPHGEASLDDARVARRATRARPEREHALDGRRVDAALAACMPALAGPLEFLPGAARGAAAARAGLLAGLGGRRARRHRRCWASWARACRGAPGT